MRTIKFRAWDKKNGKMYLPGPAWKFELDGTIRVPESKNLMQFTGLLDKNGKEIYEGDIVLMDEETNEQTECEVCWLDGGFVLVGDGYKSEAIGPQIRSYPTGMFGRVIGNIYQNHELLTPQS